MKKKLLTILGIVIAVPLIMFFTLVLYFTFFDDDEEASTNDYSSSEKSELIIINDVDVSSKLQVKKIDDIMYANGKSFIESFASSDMSEDMHHFNYKFIENRDEIYDYLSEFKEGESYLDDKFSHLLDSDAILVISWFTEAPLYMLFVDSTDVVRFGEMEVRNEIITIDEAPRIIDDEVYIPMEAFSKMTEFKIEIKN